MTKNSFSQKLLLFAILIISFFGMNLEEGKAQPPCQTGFTSITLPVTVDGCVYEVRICYKCSVVMGNPSEVYLYSYRPVDPNCIQTKTDEEIMNLLTEEALTKLALECRPKPCDQLPKMRYIVNQYACWKRLADKTVVACETNAVCQSLYEACIDNQGTVRTKISSVWQFGFEPTCSWPPIPGRIPEVQPGQTETDCFRLKTQCEF